MIDFLFHVEQKTTASQFTKKQSDWLVWLAGFYKSAGKELWHYTKFCSRVEKQVSDMLWWKYPGDDLYALPGYSSVLQIILNIPE